MLPDRIKARSDLGVAARRAKKSPTPDHLIALDNARRDYAAVALEEVIREIVEAAPPLTVEQRTRLAVLLRPDVGSAA